MSGYDPVVLSVCSGIHPSSGLFQVKMGCGKLFVLWALLGNDFSFTGLFQVKI